MKPAFLGNLRSDDDNANETLAWKYNQVSFELLPIKLVGEAFKLRNRMKKSSSCVCVLHESLHIVLLLKKEKKWHFRLPDFFIIVIFFKDFDWLID